MTSCLRRIGRRSHNAQRGDAAPVCYHARVASLELPIELFTGAVAVLASAVGLLYREGRRESLAERERWRKQVQELQLELAAERQEWRQERERLDSELSAERLRRESGERRHLQDAEMFLTALARRRFTSPDSTPPSPRLPSPSSASFLVEDWESD